MVYCASNQVLVHNTRKLATSLGLNLNRKSDPMQRLIPAGATVLSPTKRIHTVTSLQAMSKESSRPSSARRESTRTTNNGELLAEPSRMQAS